MQIQHTQPLIAPAQAPNAFGPGAAMAPQAHSGLVPASANQANNGGAPSSGCSSNQSSLLFIQQVFCMHLQSPRKLCVQARQLRHALECHILCAVATDTLGHR